MTPVMQTRTGKGGNCFQACLASLFDLPLEEVPDFCNMPGDWLSRCNRWLYQNMNLCILSLPWGVLSKHWSDMDRGLCLLSGPNRRGVRHSVVGRFQMHDDGTQDCICIHNPNPNDWGELAEVDTVDVFLVANPHVLAGGLRLPATLEEADA